MRYRGALIGGASVALLAIVACWGRAAGAAEHLGVLRAERLEIVGKDGKVCAVVEEDEEGYARLLLGGTREDPTVSLSERGLEVHSPAGGTAVISNMDGEVPSFAIYDRKDTEVAAMRYLDEGGDTAGPFLELRNGKGDERVLLAIGKRGNGLVEAIDADGHARAFPREASKAAAPAAARGTVAKAKAARKRTRRH